MIPSTSPVTNAVTEAADEVSETPCLPADAYEASAADRRGLSDELVRLHEELSQSNNYVTLLEQQVSDLVSLFYFVQH